MIKNLLMMLTILCTIGCTINPTQPINDAITVTDTIYIHDTLIIIIRDTTTTDTKISTQLILDYLDVQYSTDCLKFPYINASSSAENKALIGQDGSIIQASVDKSLVYIKTVADTKSISKAAISDLLNLQRDRLIKCAKDKIGIQDPKTRVDYVSMLENNAKNIFAETILNVLAI